MKDPGTSVNYREPSPSRTQLVAVGGIFLLVVIGVVPWRNDAIYGGGADTVVLAKAAISLLAFFLALFLRLRTKQVSPVGAGPAGILALVALLSLLGSLISGHFGPTLVLVIRILLLIATALLLYTCVPWAYVFGCLLSALGIVATVAAVTGLGTMADGRLAGGTPQIHPNELAALSAAPLVGVIALALRNGLRLWQIFVATGLLAIILASGSRAALLGVALAIPVAVVTNGRLERRAAVLLIALVPVAYAVSVFTGFFASLATRGGTTEATTALDSRFDAWAPVLSWPWTSWEKWIGMGLSVKEIEVDVQWHDTQVLDSSWVSLLAQSGVLGTVLVALLALWALTAALVSTQRRGVALPLLTLVLARSFTESGLVDSTVQLLVFLTVTTLLTHRSSSGPGRPVLFDDAVGGYREPRKY